MPVVHHDDVSDEALNRRLLPSRWEQHLCFDQLVHLVFVRTLYFGTSTQYLPLCGSQEAVPVSEEPTLALVTCMVCLSNEQEQDRVETSLSSSNHVGLRSSTRRRVGARRAR